MPFAEGALKAQSPLKIQLLRSSKEAHPGARSKGGEGATSMIKMLINEGYFVERYTAAQVRDDLTALKATD